MFIVMYLLYGRICQPYWSYAIVELEFWLGFGCFHTKLSTFRECLMHA